LQRPRISAETRLDQHRSIAYVAHRSLRAFERARGKGEALLEILAPRAGFSGRVHWDRPQLVQHARRCLGKFSLASSELLNQRHEFRAIVVGLFEQSREGECQQPVPLVPDRETIGEGEYRRLALVDRHSPRRDPPDEFGDLGLVPPNSDPLKAWPAPENTGGECRHEALLARPIRVIAWAGRSARNSSRPAQRQADQ
jgi:hypothetical protein